MKKILTTCLLTVLVCSLILTGCGNKKNTASAVLDETPTATISPSATPAATPQPNIEASAQPDQPTATPEPTPEAPAVIDITEENFAQTVEDILNHPEAYLEKTIRLQGLYLEEKTDNPNFTIHYVYRLGPAEEDSDSMDETFWGIQFIPPADFTAGSGDWVCVEGKLRLMPLNGVDTPILDESRVVIDNENRGAETLPAIH